jgi:hypothetical protein
MLYKAHDAAIKTGAAITNKRVSITDNPLKLLKLNTENNITIQYNCIRNSKYFLKFFVEVSN